jgi:hypothetical protein
MNAERIFRLLLRVYPAKFRSEYAREMTLVFRDECRSSDATAAGFWAAMVWDVARSALSMWVEEFSARDSRYTRTLEGIMKLTGMAAMLLGVYGALNALAEGVAGMGVTLEGTHLVAVVLGAIAAALLLAAGAAMVRGALSGHTATVALMASLAIALVARLAHPWMSMFSQFAGIVLPIALLAALQWPRTRGPSKPGAA